MEDITFGLWSTEGVTCGPVYIYRTVRRRWWQFWKPREWTVPVAVLDADPVLFTPTTPAEGT